MARVRCGGCAQYLAIPVGALLFLCIPTPAKAGVVATSTIYENTVWTASESPYILQSQLTVSSGATLTIEPGAVVKFPSIAQSPLVIHGSLVAGVSGGSEVVFTSIADDEYGGDSNNDAASTTPETTRWSAILFDRSSPSSVANARFRYGGRGETETTGGVLSVQESTLTISESEFESVPGYVFFLGSESELSIEQSVFESAFYLVRLWGSGSAATSSLFSMHESSAGDLEAIIHDRAGLFVADITRNWWGMPEGPYDPVQNPGGDQHFGVGFSLATFMPVLSCDPAVDELCLEPDLSSVLFLPGIEASRLYLQEEGGERQLWEPSIYTDIPLLSMDEEWSDEVYTKDIIDSIYGNDPVVGPLVEAALGANSLVYKGLAEYFDDMAASTTIKFAEWRAYPYDWRYDVRDIIENGTRTKLSDGSIATVYLEDLVEELAENSHSGKVAIVAHSNGGLLAKALLMKLEEEGKEDLVERLIMIGTPQWGTPAGIGAMLHGDDHTRGLGLIVYGGDVREAAATMPAPYALLPSERYFAEVAAPVAAFAGGALTTPFRDAFPHGIASFESLVSFVTDGLSLNAGISDEDDLNIPLALSAELVEKARSTHAALDAWEPPESVGVTALAGWGQLTTYSYGYSTAQGHSLCAILFSDEFCERSQVFLHTAFKSEDGDDTVVTPSAIGGMGDAWYFNTKQYQRDGLGRVLHRNLPAAVPVLELVSRILLGDSFSVNYLSTSRPDGDAPNLIRIAGMSPVNVLATDASGNQTGIIPLPGIPGIYTTVQNIPGSAVDISGEEKFVYLPQGGEYSFAVTGYDSGMANIQVESIGADGEAEETTIIADIPVAVGTLSSFSLSAVNELSNIAVDYDGDGSSEYSLVPEPGALIAYAPPEEEVAEESIPAPASSSSGGGASAERRELPMPETETASSTPEESEVVVPEEVETAPFPAPEEETAPQELEPAIPSARVEEDAEETTTVPILQTASAYTALSQASPAGTLERMYHVFKGIWRSFSGLLNRLL